MTKENISVKFLIHLVGERPALWDKTSDDYKDRALKETSWREICTYVNENYNSMPKKAKEEFTKMITKKWTHIRDSWVKSMKNGYDPVTKKPPKPYIYHNELNFMQKILLCKTRRFNLNMSQLSNMNFEDFYREKNETQNSNDTSHEMENNEYDEAEQDGDLSIANYKQDDRPDSSNKLKVIVVNKTEEDVDDVDDCDFEDTEITPVIDQESNKQTEPIKKKRQSIFVSSRNEEEYEETKLMPPVVVAKAVSKVEAPETPSVVLPAKHMQTNYHQRHHQSVYENRHWSFFKGILPSINGLDEDHVLQFQSGVIVLLQKLRESQKQKSNSKSNQSSFHSAFKSRNRKCKTSVDNDDWPTHNINTRKRSRRQISDPIAAEEEPLETEYSSES